MESALRAAATAEGVDLSPARRRGERGLGPAIGILPDGSPAKGLLEAFLTLPEVGAYPDDEGRLPEAPVADEVMRWAMSAHALTARLVEHFRPEPRGARTVALNPTPLRA